MIRGPIGPKGPHAITSNTTGEQLTNDQLFPAASRRMLGQHPDYDKLPVSIQAQVSQKDYLWLDDDGKRNLITDFTMPEVAED